MEVPIKGFCPTQNKEYTVYVSYRDARNLSNDPVYVKCMSRCEFAKSDCDCPIKRECPILLQAPERIRGRS